MNDDAAGRLAVAGWRLALVALVALGPLVAGSPAAATAAAPSPAPPGSWTPTEKVPEEGGAGIAVRLLDGRVLRLQYSQNQLVFTAFVYRPTVGGGTWASVAPPPQSQPMNMVLLHGPGCGLHCGRVLVQFFYPHVWALFDPPTGTWLPTGRTIRYRMLGEPTATLITGSPERCADPLANCGKVLTVGGYQDSQPLSGKKIPELWDPNTGVWTEVGELAHSRVGHGAVGLSDGRVLVAGGSENEPGDAPTEAEVFDPLTKTWSSAGTTRPMIWPKLVRLPRADKVLALGGGTKIPVYDPVAPAASAWTERDSCGLLRCGSPVLLPSGKVLTAGGPGNPGFSGRRQAFLYDPEADAWSEAASLHSDFDYSDGEESNATFTLLDGSPDQCGAHCGKVLAAGGRIRDPVWTGSWEPQDKAELYTPGPSVDAVSPGQGPTAGGTRVTVTGRYFLPGATVAFGEAPGRDVQVSQDGTTITATSPQHPPGAVHVRVTTAGGTSAATPADLFTYLPPPMVSGIEPPGGPASGGTAVTIVGSGFAGATSVSFGGTPAARFSVSGDGRTISAVTPAHDPGPVPVVVATPLGGPSAEAAAARFTYGPLITGLFPARGETTGGTAVAIGGKGFARATTAVRFGGVPATFTVRSDTEITATAPPHAVAEGVRVEVATVEGLVSVPSVPDANLFTYFEPAPADTGNTDDGGNEGVTDKDPPVSNPATPGGGAPATDPAPAPGPSPGPSPGPAASSSPAPGPANAPAPGTSSAPANAPAGAKAPMTATSPANSPVNSSVASNATATAPGPAPGPAPSPAAASASAGPTAQPTTANTNSAVGRDGEEDGGVIQHAMVGRRDEELVVAWGAAAVVVVAGCVAIGAPRARRRTQAGAPRPRGAYR